MRGMKGRHLFEEGWWMHCMGGGNHLRQFNLPLGGRPDGDYTPPQVACYLGSSGHLHSSMYELPDSASTRCRALQSGGDPSLGVLMVGGCIVCKWKWLSNKPSSFCSVYVCSAFASPSVVAAGRSGHRREDQMFTSSPIT